MTGDQGGLDGARLIDVPAFSDARGTLAAFEKAQPLPFDPLRTFVIFDVPPGAHRAQHVLSCDQFLWMAVGACLAIVGKCAEQDPAIERRFHLVQRGPGLYLPGGVWLDLLEFTPGGILICLAESGYVPRTIAP